MSSLRSGPVPLDCDISVSFWQLQCLFIPVCLSAGAVAISSLGRNVPLLLTVVLTAYGKVEGGEEESGGCRRGEKTGGGSCLQQALRAEVTSATADSF